MASHELYKYINEEQQECKMAWKNVECSKHCTKSDFTFGAYSHRHTCIHTNTNSFTHIYNEWREKKDRRIKLNTDTAKNTGLIQTDVEKLWT